MPIPRAGRHSWRLILAAVVILVIVGVVLGVEGSRRFDALATADARATAAVSRARAADAAVWAPEELLSAESALREGRAALRVQQVAWWPLPDTHTVSEAFGRAETLAGRADVTATERRRTAETAADAALEAAAGAVAASTTLADAIHVGAERRALLARARTALDEARIYRREGDVGTATLRARQAQDLAGQVRSHAAEVAARYSDGETVARWQRWRQETIDWSRRTGRVAILVSKAEHSLTLVVAGRPVKSYRADMGFNWIADKSHAGDGATPEGRYRVVSRKANGASIYYKALLLDYPNAEDRAQFSRSRRAGELPASAAIGGLIEIHGEGGRGRDWTRGCVAVTNAEMDELFRYVDVGTPVTIIGSDTHGAIAELTAGTGGPETTR